MNQQADGWVAVAVIVRPHALRGALVLKAFTREPEDFIEAPVKRFHLRRKSEILPGTLTVQSLSIHKGAPVALFEEVTDRTSAEKLVGVELVIREEERWELDDDEHYSDDLVGLAVVEEVGGRDFGAVLRVTEGAAHDYLIFAHPDGGGKEVMLPFVPEFVPEIDVAGSRVIVRIPEGLLDL
jgi:16S rRNA processing protein RimM